MDTQPPSTSKPCALDVDRAAEQRSAATFASGMSHAVANLLQRSQAAIDILGIKLAGQTQLVDLLERIQTAQNRLTRLIRQARELNSPLELRFAPCEWDDAVQQAWKEAVAARNDKSLTWTGLPARPPAAEARVDPVYLQRALRYVLENALDCGAVSLEACWPDPDQGGENCYISWELADDRPNFSTPAQESQLFEPFGSPADDLGMAIAKRIIAAHGGQVAARARPQGGAAVRIALPCS